MCAGTPGEEGSLRACSSHSCQALLWSNAGRVQLSLAQLLVILMPGTEMQNHAHLAVGPGLKGKPSPLNY